MTLWQVRLSSGELHYVVAENGYDAQHFLGVRDGSASVHPVAWKVEVDGLHPTHQPLAPNPITKVPQEFGVMRFTASSGRNNDFDTRDASGFRAEDYSAECAAATCNCAPTCGLCGKEKMYDTKRLPGWHDWACPECHAHGNLPWKEKESEVVDVPVN